MQARGGGGDDPDGAREHQGRGRDFAPGRPPLMVALGSKELFQRVIGAWEIRDGIAVKEAWPVTAGDLEEMGQRGCECPSGRLVPGQPSQQATQASLHRCPGQLVFVGEDLRHPLDPAVGKPHVGPQRGSGRQTPLEEGLQSSEWLGERPFFPSRARLWETALSRSWSLRPEATKGGRPSSVRALRTALQ